MHFLASAERGFAQLAELVRLGAYAWLLSRLLSPYVRRNNAVQTALAAARRVLSAALSKQKAPHADDAAAKKVLAGIEAVRQSESMRIRAARDLGFTVVESYEAQLRACAYTSGLDTPGQAKLRADHYRKAAEARQAKQAKAAQQAGATDQQRAAARRRRHSSQGTPQRARRPPARDDPRAPSLHRTRECP